MTLPEAIRHLLILTWAPNVFLVEAPPLDEVTVTVRPYASSADPDLPLGSQSVQVAVKAATYGEGEAVAWATYKTLCSARPACDRDVLSVVPLQEPYLIGKDDNGKYVFVFNMSYKLLWKE